MKMNKKGFTLIEMLVVIAIIAVLVSIVIPTVTSATTKAAAATNAANLRSFKAELTTAVLAGGELTADADNHQWSNATNTITAPQAKAVTFKNGNANVELKPTAEAPVYAGADLVNGAYQVYFQVGETKYYVEDFAQVADGGKLTTKTTMPTEAAGE